MPRECRHPHCHVVLAEANTSGVCRAHNHTEWCRCGPCMGRGDDYSPSPKLKHPGDVTLPPFPWEEPKE